MATAEDSKTVKRAERSLLIVMAAVVAVVAIIAIIGFLVMNRPDSYIEGQAEGLSLIHI